MTRYYVVSPEYETYHGGGYDPPEPPEWGCDFVEIEADSKRDALILGVREIMRTQKRHSWAHDNQLDGKPPWAGYKVEIADESDARY